MYPTEGPAAGAAAIADLAERFGAPTIVKCSTNLCAMVAAGHQRSRDLDRFITFVDAVAAVAITLLVLPLVDLAAEFRSDRGSVGHLIATHGDRFWAFALSFVVIARLWWVQHEMMRPVIEENRHVVWCLLLWSFVIVFLPFPTALLPIGGDQAVTKILYIGALTLASTLLALLAAAIGRSSSIRDTDAGPAVAPSAVTAVLFAVALVISLAFPETNYYPLALLLLVDVAVEAIQRFRRRRPRHPHT